MPGEICNGGEEGLTHLFFLNGAVGPIIRRREVSTANLLLMDLRRLVTRSLVLLLDLGPLITSFIVGQSACARRK